jgi:DNA-directed RNA polymerase subunit beta'
MLIDEGDSGRARPAHAEWVPLHAADLTEVEGTIISRTWSKASDVGDARRSTGIAKRVVIDWRTGPGARSQERASMVIEGQQDPRAQLRGEAFTLAVDATIPSDPCQGEGGRRHRPDPDRKRQDRTPAACRGWRELFEARKPKDAAHRGGVRHHPLLEGLQEQAPHHRSG